MARRRIVRIPSRRRRLRAMRQRGRDRVVATAVELYAAIYDEYAAAAQRILREFWIPRNADVLTDAGEDLARDLIRAAWGRLRPKPDFRRTLARIAALMQAQSDEELYAVGVPAVRISTLVPLGEIEAFVQRNAALITGLDDLARTEVEKFFASNPTGHVGQLASELQKRTGVGRRRAEFWARDQTLKLHGQVTESRHRQLGVQRYVWTTSNDESVRETHIELEGTIQSWDDPPAVTGHPGQDYQCRCSAFPLLDDPGPGEAPGLAGLDLVPFSL